MSCRKRANRHKQLTEARLDDKVENLHWQLVEDEVVVEASSKECPGIDVANEVAGAATKFSFSVAVIADVAKLSLVSVIGVDIGKGTGRLAEFREIGSTNVANVEVTKLPSDR